VTRFVVVTGTGTRVGKTVTTAALARAAEADGSRVSVVKPYQTGVTGDEPSDVATVTALSGCTDVHELVRLDDALAPESAARLRGVDIASVEDLVGVGRDLTLVEGAGGVAVRLDLAGGTIATLAVALRDAGRQVEVLVVTSLGLGTLNHTELTVEALRRQGLEPSGLALGAVPGELGLAERCNLDDLPRLTRVPVVARIPAGAGALETAEFRAAAPTWVL
jgi:dethiobiotin synthetase